MTQTPHNIELSADQFKTVKQLIEQYLPNTEVWAYGSRVKNKASTYSDLDLVAFTTEQQKLALFNLKQAFEDSSLPFRVDIFAWDELPDSFQENIKTEHILFQ